MMEGEMGSNAYEQGKQIARQKAEEATCFVPLSLLQDLLAEIDRLRPRQVESVGEVVTNLRKPKEPA
jgi:hypothetical protein